MWVSRPWTRKKAGRGKMGAMDLRGAVLRGWRLVLLLGLLGAVVGALTAPSAPATPKAGAGTAASWSATTIIGPTPGHGHIPLTTIYIDVKNPAVVAAAAENSGAGVPATALEQEISIESGREALGLGKRGNHWVRLHAIGVRVTWFSEESAIALANSMASAVSDYINARAQLDYTTGTAVVAKAVANLQNQLSDIDSQLAGSSAPTGSTAFLEIKKRVLQGRLATAIHEQVDLSVSGPKPPGYEVLQAAHAVGNGGGAKATVASIVNHKWTRVLGGLVVGVLIAVGIIVAVEALDRSLRTVRATEEAFDLPVVAEIPAHGTRRQTLQRAPADTRLEVIDDPGSQVAEAYRRLHTAVLLEPLASELVALTNGNGNGYANGNGNGYANGNGNGYGGRVGGAVPGYPVRPGGPEDVVHDEPGNGPNGWGPRRQVLLVVSPGVEPTRSAVVANLAAVCAEAGASALVVSVGNLEWRRNGNGSPATARGEEISATDLVPFAEPSAVEGVSRLRFEQLLESRGQVVTQGPAIIAAARQVADFVLVETPSLLMAHDAVALLPAVDVVLVVAQHGLTRSDQAREAGDVLRRFRAPVLGVALTNVPRRGGSVRVSGREPKELFGTPVPEHAPPDRTPSAASASSASSASSSQLWL